MLRPMLCAALAAALAASCLWGTARALSAAVARKCLALTMQEYPRPKGYAAYKPGHAGTAKAREDYYRACVAKALSQGEGSTDVKTQGQ
jgi:hypothetical protein